MLRGGSAVFPLPSIRGRASTRRVFGLASSRRVFEQVACRLSLRPQACASGHSSSRLPGGSPRAFPSPWSSVASASAFTCEIRSAPRRRSSRAPGQLPSRGRGCLPLPSSLLFSSLLFLLSSQFEAFAFSSGHIPPSASPSPWSAPEPRPRLSSVFRLPSLGCGRQPALCNLCFCLSLERERDSLELL